jgi:ribonuclease D
VETDNKDLRKRIDHARDQLKLETDRKLAGIKACEKGFSPARYLRSVSKAETDASPRQTEKDRMPVFKESDISHPALYEDLKGWRSREAKDKGVPAFQIMHQRVLIQIAVHLPDNPTDLQRIKGVGQKTVQKYGEALIQRVSAYRRKHGIQTMETPDPKGSERDERSLKNKPPDTKQISLDMFNNGAAVSDIAKERGLSDSTVWGHLGFFVEKGKLSIDRLLSFEQQSAIETALSKTPGNSLKMVRDALGDAYSYGEIKLMLSYRKFLSAKESA